MLHKTNWPVLYLENDYTRLPSMSCGHTPDHTHIGYKGAKLTIEMRETSYTH